MSKDGGVESVIRDGFCVGCGICQVAAPDTFKLSINVSGEDSAEIQPSESSVENIRRVDSICPFSNYSSNEDEVANQVFINDQKYDNGVGFYDEIFAARSLDKNVFNSSSSGGLLRMTLKSLLEKKIVKGVISVRNKPSSDSFEYFVTDEPSQTLTAATSAYSPVTLNKLADFIIDHPENYVIVGLPCFLKALRNYFSKVAGLSVDKHPILLGIICGHLKSKLYGHMLSQQIGIERNSIRHINYREKIPGAAANEKGFKVTYSDKNIAKSKAEIVQNLFGTDYGFGFFKYKACDYCDDVFAEVADASFGDAWLPEYLEESHSLVVSRSAKISKLFSEFADKKLVRTSVLDASRAVQAQNAGLRHRREGLSYRLYLDAIKGKWAPKKRVIASQSTLTNRQKIIQRMRIWVRERAPSDYLEAAEKNDYTSFYRRYVRTWRIYRAVYGSLRYFPVRLVFAYFGQDIDAIVRRIFNVR